MPYIQPEPSTFFNIKLTDQGRLALSEGYLSFVSIILSDNEIDYSVTRLNNYNLFNNKILDIASFPPDGTSENMDGRLENLLLANQIEDLQGERVRSQIELNEPLTNFNITTEKITITASTSSTTISNFVSLSKTLTYSNNSTNWGTNKITLGAAGGTPSVGQLICIPWVSPDYSGTYDSNNLPQSEPSVLSFYKITSAVTSGTVYLVDRPIPDFSTGNNPVLTCQIFNDNIIESHLGTGYTTDPGIWNMNIVRTNTVMGTQLSVANGVSGYTTYGSIEFNGTRNYFGFTEDTPAFGVIHYTNKWTGNTYGERFVEGTFELNLPGIMWYHNVNSYYNNDQSIPFTTLNSSGTTWGVYLTDFTGDTKYDPVTKSTYRDLIDGRTDKSLVVGRVYHSLQVVLITDQELLTALTYKSNRNYTLPNFEASTSLTPQIGFYPPGSISATTLSGYTASPFIEDGFDYFVTYIMENDPYTSSSSIGNAPSLPCGYIKKIDGLNSSNGNKLYLKVRFPYSNSFPYMRDDTELASTNYGTGWNANTCQILINKQSSFAGYDIQNVPYTEWRRISNKSLGGNGVYRASDYGLNTIDPKLLNSYEFIISEEDFNSGSTYVINTGLTSGQSFLNFGDECFVYGTIKTGIASVVYKSSIQIYLDDTEVNSSINPTFDPERDKSTYITEVTIMDEFQRVVAVGKPTYPIKKNNTRWITLKLEMDF